MEGSLLTSGETLQERESRACGVFKVKQEELEAMTFPSAGSAASGSGSGLGLTLSSVSVQEAFRTPYT